MTFCPVDFVQSPETVQCMFYSRESVWTLVEAQSLVYAHLLQFLSPSALVTMLWPVFLWSLHTDISWYNLSVLGLFLLKCISDMLGCFVYLTLLCLSTDYCGLLCSHTHPLVLLLLWWTQIDWMCPALEFLDLVNAAISLNFGLVQSCNSSKIFIWSALSAPALNWCSL